MNADFVEDELVQEGSGSVVVWWLLFLTDTGDVVASERLRLKELEGKH